MPQRHGGDAGNGGRKLKKGFFMISGGTPYDQVRNCGIVFTAYCSRYSQKIIHWIPILTSISSFGVRQIKMCDMRHMADNSPHLKNQPKWFAEKSKFLHMPLEEKRAFYKCQKNFQELSKIQAWKQVLKSESSGDAANANKFSANDGINAKVSMWQGDITTLEIGAIVNAANSSLLGGGGVDGAIHRAAGKDLTEECDTLNGCEEGSAKISGGYRLPAKYVIHTVGPRYSSKYRKSESGTDVRACEEQLRNCYENCLKLVEDNDIRSVAFPCISTGIYGYPNEEAANIALDTTRRWLENSTHSEKMDRVIFCLFLGNDVAIYKNLMPAYFPRK